MSKRVFIIHGWGGWPEEGWFPWLKKELAGRGYETTVLAMPDSGTPRIDAWVGHIADAVGTSDNDTVLVGHSIGAQAVLRYLARLPAGVQIGAAVCVAGWCTVQNLESADEWAIVEPWLAPLDFGTIKKHLSKCAAVFSDNDPFVPLEENVEVFKNQLGAKIIIEHNQAHLNGEAGVTELPSALAAVLAC